MELDNSDASQQIPTELSNISCIYNFLRDLLTLPSWLHPFLYNCHPPLSPWMKCTSLIITLSCNLFHTALWNGRFCWNIVDEISDIRWVEFTTHTRYDLCVLPWIRINCILIRVHLYLVCTTDFWPCLLRHENNQSWDQEIKIGCLSPLNFCFVVVWLLVAA